MIALPIKNDCRARLPLLDGLQDVAQLAAERVPDPGCLDQRVRADRAGETRRSEWTANAR